jgi:mono/diheme cytochrome c family protein
MSRRLASCAAMFAALAGAAPIVSAADKADPNERGRYIVTITGCNDCHTEGYAPSAGKVPEKEWLKGSRVGHRGPWGTTYAPNLRMYFAKLSEQEWVKSARALKTRPPMPYFSVNAMREQDLRAIYRFVRSLGPVGEPAPTSLPPGSEPPQPFVVWPAGPG